MSERRRFGEETSMERNRDLRDYALVNGFRYAKELISYLKTQLKSGDALLDLGSGNAKAIAEAARRLTAEGIRCLALDNHPPKKRSPAVDYITSTFDDTQLKSNSVEMILSVCGLFMYAENENALYDHAAEVGRIMTDTGKLSVVVKPVIRVRGNEQLLAELSADLKDGAKTLSKEEERDIRQKISKIKDTRRFEHNLGQLRSQEIWVQSPTESNKYFEVNIFDILKEAGLNVDQRVMPLGGMMIDDEITLIISKI